MAGGNLSPRQKMINMMYLVLTALLALNVSKEVLNSFFEVNKGIERTTNNFNAKNASTYADFENAASNNPEKYKEVRDKAYLIRNKADATSLFIQEMKYDLVAKVDKNKIYLGSENDIYNSEGELIENLAIIDKKFSELSKNQRTMPIAYLKNKSNRYASQDLFYPKDLKSGDKKRATELKEKIEDYRDFLIDLAGDNQALIDNINVVFDVSERVGKKKQNWEEYNFVDMPSVSALTILSKIQSDLRNTEADVIDYLKKDIDSKSLKFKAAEGIQIPSSNFVMKGDSFRSEIFITANNPDQNPDIFVGDYDSIGDGVYKMVGEYETVKVVNGKGIFSRKENTEGIKKYGGLITMKTETGTKMYPFNGEYLVAEKMVVAAPTNMNVLYKGINNPISVSVAGYNASQVSVECTNGSITTINKRLGKYEVKPEKLMQEDTPIIKLFVTVDGKRKYMDAVKFKVKDVPAPEIMCAKKFGGIIEKGDLANASGLFCIMKDFPFDRKALSYQVISYDVSAYSQKGVKRNIPTIKGNKFNQQVIDAIKGTAPGNDITFTNIKAKLRGVKKTRTITNMTVSFTIK